MIFNLPKIKTIIAHEPDLSSLDSAKLKKACSAWYTPLLMASVGLFGKFSSLTIFIKL